MKNATLALLFMLIILDASTLHASNPIKLVPDAPGIGKQSK
jgi:hypothetical protein